MFIFNPDNIYQKEKMTQEESYEYYLPVGLEEYMDNGYPRSKSDSENVCAKKITRVDGSVKYLIKLDRTSKLFDPYSKYDKDYADQKFLNSVCRTDNRFKEVNEKAFQFYTRFLSLKNHALLQNAEREIY
jgi:hypothetical protein